MLRYPEMPPDECFHVEVRSIFLLVVPLDDQDRIFEWNSIGECFGIGENVAGLHVTEQRSVQLFGRDVRLAVSE